MLTQMAGHKRRQQMPTIKPKQIDLFCQALRMKLKEGKPGFAKQYLRYFVSEIRVTGNEVVMTGSNAALAAAIAETKKGTSHEVPKSVLGWLPDLGSNQGPTD